MFDFLDIDVVQYAHYLMALKIVLMLINSYLIKDLYLIGLYMVCQIMWWFQYFDKNLTNFMTGTIQYEIILALVLAIIFYTATMMYECLLLLLIFILSYILYQIYTNPELVQFKTKQGNLIKQEYLPGSWICFSFIGVIITYFTHKYKNGKQILYETWVALFLGGLAVSTICIYHKQDKIPNTYLMVEEQTQKFILWNLIPLIVIITLIAVLIMMQYSKKKPDAFLYEQLNSQIDEQKISSHHLDTGEARLIISQDTHRQQLEIERDPEQLSDLQLPVSQSQLLKPYTQHIVHKSFHELSQNNLDQFEVNAVYVEDQGEQNLESPLKQIDATQKDLKFRRPEAPIIHLLVENQFAQSEGNVSILNSDVVISETFQSHDSYVEEQCPICNFCSQPILFSSIYLICHHQYHEQCLRNHVGAQLQRKAYQITCMCNQKIYSNIINKLEIIQFNQLCQNQLQRIIQQSKGYLNFKRCSNVFCEFFIVDTANEPFFCSICD